VTDDFLAFISTAALRFFLRCCQHGAADGIMGGPTHLDWNDEW